MTLLLASCASGPSKLSQDGAPSYKIDVSKIPNAIPKVEPRSRYGNPKNYRVNGKTYHIMSSGIGYKERGIASWYGTKFHGQYTSSREPYNMLAMTAAHKTLPIPAYVRVTNLENDRQIIVKVNDRGPFAANRLIDLSYAAAKKLGIIQKGTGLVEIETINPNQSNAATQYATEQVTQTKHKLNHPHPILYMQIGAFSSEANASQLASRVRRLTARAVHIKSNRSTGRVLYRVLIGPLTDVSESDELHAKLRSENLGNPITVVD